ncbi:MAG: FAD-dependent oxidoreductase [Alphaproteobacteria bacterium]|nr:FAD-dependent oxidoreductase [Alphaproteobacteria bacterium]
MAVETLSYDVVVVGHGIAGLAAAVSAMQQGARVAVLERAPAEESGGCTRYTEAFLRLKNEDELTDDFESLLAEVGAANPDPDLVHTTTRPSSEWPGIVRTLNATDPEFIATFARETIPTIKWLKTFGIRFIPAYLAHITCRENPPLLAPSGGGHALIEALLAAGRAGGVEIFYETTARALIQDDAGAVVGVQAVGRRNRRSDVRGRAVILASGGFEGSIEMLHRYLGPSAVNIRPVARGGHYNRGEGIRMALAIGAAPAGDFGSYHANPVDPRSGRPEAKVFLFPYGILVNKLGRRFADEGPGADHRIYDGICHRIQEQPDGTAFAILDARINDIPEYGRAVFTDKPPVMAGSLADLAGKLGLPADALKATVAAYNAACRPGTFSATRTDGLATVGIDPPKSNWARPLDRAPFMAYPLISAAIITLGGLKTNARAQVLNADGEVIPGLYAAGALMGIYYRQYAAATSVLRGATFGRIAGADAARHQAP